MADRAQEAARAGKQLTRARDKLNSDRRRLPMVKVDKKYVFDGPNGKATLPDLFEQRRQLIVYHMMLTHCPGCSLLIDNIGHRALHMIALSRLRWDTHTREYVQRRTAEGKTKPEIMRCLKRYIARQIYNLITPTHP